MIVSSLIENKKIDSSKLISEHGLSLHIQADGRKILFDTGQSGIFAENAKKLGINLHEVDVAIISHGHYDHGGGLKSFFKVNKTAPVYLKKGADENHLFKAFLFIKREIGLDKDLLDKNSSRITYLTHNQEVIKNVHLITSIKQKYPAPQGNKYLYYKKKGKMLRDDFYHELMMVIDEKDGIVIFSGCSHQGILNMIETAHDLFPHKLIKAVFGGFHLSSSLFFNKPLESPIQIREIGEKIMEYPVNKVYTGHCTTNNAYSILKDVMGSRLDYCSTGTIIHL